MTKPCLSTDETAAHRNVKKGIVHARVAEKFVPARKIGLLWKFQASAVDDWVRDAAAAGSGRDEAGD